MRNRRAEWQWVYCGMHKHVTVKSRCKRSMRASMDSISSLSTPCSCARRSARKYKTGNTSRRSLTSPRNILSLQSFSSNRRRKRVAVKPPRDCRCALVRQVTAVAAAARSSRPTPACDFSAATRHAASTAATPFWK